MRKFLQSNSAYATLFVLFTIALAVNSLSGSALPAFVAGSTTTSYAPDSAGSTAIPDARELAHGPTIPPDPWEDNSIQSPKPRPKPQLAHGPTIPPDPWEDNSIQSPKPRPKPQLAHGPTIPPDPWEDNTIQSPKPRPKKA